jgi:chemotaxis signal transduction protein
MPALMKAVKALDRKFELPQTVAHAATRGEQRWRGLRIGNLGLLIAHDSGGELLEEARVTPLPRTPPWCRGLINLRGQLIPAFDLHQRLRLMHLRPPRQWWLVIGRGVDAVAFTIDALPRSIVVDEAARIQAVAVPDNLQAFIGRAYRLSDELWLEFKYREFVQSLSGERAA